jgi:hypothetical protein
MPAQYVYVQVENGLGYHCPAVNKNTGPGSPSPRATLPFWLKMIAMTARLVCKSLRNDSQ